METDVRQIFYTRRPENHDRAMSKKSPAPAAVTERCPKNILRAVRTNVEQIFARREDDNTMSNRDFCHLSLFSFAQSPR